MRTMVTALGQLVDEAGDEFLRVHREIEVKDAELWSQMGESAADESGARFPSVFPPFALDHGRATVNRPYRKAR
jgi:hypothetical protein